MNCKLVVFSGSMMVMYIENHENIQVSCVIHFIHNLTLNFSKDCYKIKKIICNNEKMQQYKCVICILS